jgi:hypothetical protein
MQLAPNGSLVVQQYRRSQLISLGTTVTGTSATQILAAQSGGVYADIASLTITTTPGTSQAFTATLSDGTNSYVFDLDQNNAAGVNTISITFNPPLPASSAAHSWTQQNSQSVTTHTTVVAIKQTANF